MTTVAFIDGVSMHSVSRALGIEIDYKRVLSFLNESYPDFLRAYYYTAVESDEDGHVSIRPLLDYLEYNGYTLRTKPAKVFTNFDGARKTKTNMDIELVVDALDIADKVENVLLFTGDGDLKYLVLSLQRRGVHVTSVSALKTIPPIVSDELRRASDKFIDIQDIAGKITRQRAA